MKFNELQLDERILKAIKIKGYEDASLIQEKAIPYALAGRDILGCAQTGTGKTAAFALPVLQKFVNERHGYVPRTLILTPTRELATQIQENFVSYGKFLPLKSAVIFGGVSQRNQEVAIKKGIDILVATPGRLNDLINQRLIDLSKVEVFILDEADRMLDMGFLNDVKKIMKQLPDKKQTMLFSATMPKEIRSLTNSLLHDPAVVEVAPVSSTAEKIEQKLYHVDKVNKKYLLKDLLDDADVQNALVFTRTKSGANRVAKFLNTNGVEANAIHGDKSQNARQRALENFKEGKVKVLVATDIAARGIDINELSHVFNYDIPVEAEAYVHRIGRTGRAGHSGMAISFSDFNEFSHVKDIEKLIRNKIPLEDDHEYPMSDFTIAVKNNKGRSSKNASSKRNGSSNKKASYAKNKEDDPSNVQKKHHPKRKKEDKKQDKFASFDANKSRNSKSNNKRRKQYAK